MIKLSVLILDSYEELKKEAVSTKWIVDKIYNGTVNMTKNLERDISPNPRAMKRWLQTDRMSDSELRTHTLKRPDGKLKILDIVFAKNSPTRKKAQQINRILSSKKYGPSFVNRVRNS